MLVYTITKTRIIYKELLPKEYSSHNSAGKEKGEAVVGQVCCDEATAHSGSLRGRSCGEDEATTAVSGLGVRREGL